MVKLWDFELSPVAEFDVRNLRSPSQSPRIRSVDVSPDGWVGQRDPMIVVQARKAPAGQMGSLEALA